ncbi:MAG: hypothetical protein R3Y62_02705, partial [Eubacteriales bacterium]
AACCIFLCKIKRISVLTPNTLDEYKIINVLMGLTQQAFSTFLREARDFAHGRDGSGYFLS